MNNNEISLSYLQSLSTADLLLLADDYGVDIPEHLNRSFVISELYEIAQEMRSADEENQDNDLKNSNTVVDTSMELPETYNETQIDFVLRTPTWVYVFWDISKSDIQNVIELKKFSKILLKVLFWNEDSEKPEDSFEISVKENTRTQYILIPTGKKEISINIVAEASDKRQEILAESRKMKIPQEFQYISLDSLNETDSPIMELSGIDELKKQQYESHRESFI